MELVGGIEIDSGSENNLFKIPFKKIKVNIGKPIYYSKYKDEVNNKDVMDKLTEELMKTIVKLRDERI